MGIFDFFKKKEQPHYDVTNLQVKDITVGFLFDYNLTTWEVLEEYTYDWGNNEFSYEFKISNGIEVMFLHVEDDDVLSLSLTQKINISDIKTNLPQIISQSERPPHQIEFEGETYRLEKEAPGYFHEEGDDEDEWEEMMSWEYKCISNNKILCIEQWDDFKFEAAKGLEIKEYEISNILPSS